MTESVTPHDFHRMIGLRSYRPIINLEGESSVEPCIDLPGCSYSSKYVCYFDLEANFRPLFIRQLLRIGLGWLGHSCFKW